MSACRTEADEDLRRHLRDRNRPCEVPARRLSTTHSPAQGNVRDNVTPDRGATPTRRSTSAEDRAGSPLQPPTETGLHRRIDSAEPRRAAGPARRLREGWTRAAALRAQRRRRTVPLLARIGCKEPPPGQFSQRTEVIGLPGSPRRARALPGPRPCLTGCATEAVCGGGGGDRSRVSVASGNHRSGQESPGRGHQCWGRKPSPAQSHMRGRLGGVWATSEAPSRDPHRQCSG